MDLEIYADSHFVAWTHIIRYEDISRFPARIMAAATALYAEGQRGEYTVSVRGTVMTIKRK